MSFMLTTATLAIFPPPSGSVTWASALASALSEPRAARSATAPATATAITATHRTATT